MYVITGATGNTGKVVAENLLNDGYDVTVISRKKENLKRFEDKGAKPAIGDLTDIDFLKDVFKGAKGAYLVIPPKNDAPDFRAYQNEVGEALASVIESEEVPYAVSLSSFGAHMREGNGVVQGLYDFEKRLNAIWHLNVIHLRAGFFMQNLYNSIPLIKHQNINGGFPISGDIKLPVIHTNDIGKEAYERLKNLDFTGKSMKELAGAKDYNMEEITKIIGENIGKPDLSYVAFGYEDAKQAMMQMGLSEDLADRYIEFSKAVNEGKLYEGYKRREANTTETSLEEFIKNEFVPAYQNS